MPGPAPVAWSLLLALAPGQRVLEVSEDDGARAEALAALGVHAVCLRPSEAAVAKLGARGMEAYSIEAAYGAAPGDAAVVAVALGRTRGTGWVTRDLASLLAAVASRLKPGAPIVVALPNPLFELPFVGALLDRLQPEIPTRLKPRGHLTLGSGGERGLRQALERAGLVEVRVFAALPGGARPKFLVPLGCRAAIDYFFRALLPRAGSLAKRRAVSLAAASARLGVFARVVPAYEIAAMKP